MIFLSDIKQFFLVSRLIKVLICSYRRKGIAGDLTDGADNKNSHREIWLILLKSIVSFRNHFICELQSTPKNRFFKK